MESIGKDRDVRETEGEEEVERWKEALCAAEDGKTDEEKDCQMVRRYKIR